MAGPDPWPTIQAERKALAADLQGLTDDQWRTPSLCTGWTVEQVLGHMTATARMTPPGFFIKMLKSGFAFAKMADAAIATETKDGPARTLASFEQIEASKKHPPGPIDTWLGETIVHAEDIRRPLGIKHEYPTDALQQVADFYKDSNLLIGAKKRIAGLTLRATDADWSTGSGPEAAGPLVSLVMTMTGRRPAVDDLAGDGVDTLRSRI
ncbi:MAG: hypothetical protein QOJ09_3098 [Actinomycetota bacterium]|jgi:uncharacterized protein (TIGR03083 family)|nr:hypothetical protein [Actinomycetota bacterium]